MKIEEEAREEAKVDSRNLFEASLSTRFDVDVDANANPNPNANPTAV